MANITRDRFPITAAPATPGANKTNAATSPGTWSGCLARTCAAGTATAASCTQPGQEQDRSRGPGAGPSNTDPSRAEMTGNALMTTDMASTADMELNTCEA